MKNETKKKRIELCVILALVLVFAVIVAVDVLRSTDSAPLDTEGAGKLLAETVSRLPGTGAGGSEYLAEQLQLTVDAVTETAVREYRVECTYTTVQLLAVYQSHKDELFQSAYAYYQEAKQRGEMVNSAKLRQKLLPEIEQWLGEASPVTGKAELYLYQVSESVADGDHFAIPLDGYLFRAYMPDELVDELFGGLLSVRADIASTETLQTENGVVDLKKMNTLRTGINECFGVYAYRSEKPDASPSVFVNAWNKFADEFYRNFIEKARWEYLAKGLLVTLEVTFFAALFGVVLGFLCAVIRCTHDKTGSLMIPDQIVRLYLTVIRGTPVMVQLLIIYFVILLPIGIEKMPAAILCFSINSGAYVCEIIRGGIMAVDNGQMEAGRSLGLTYMQTMTSIVMPQAFKAVLPALVNEFIALLKESSVAFYIGVADLTQGGLTIRSITYSNFMPLIAVAAVYLAVVLILTRLVGILERRLRKSER